MEMEEKKMMSIVNDDGSIDEVEVIVAFSFKDTNKEYVVYTKNEKDEKGNITIYVSGVTYEGEEAVLTSVPDDTEWSRIKDVLRELSKDETEEQ